jgi:hypothetical protein
MFFTRRRNPLILNKQLQEEEKLIKNLTFEHLIFWLKVHFTLAIKLRELLQLWCTNSERLKEFRFIL